MQSLNIEMVLKLEAFPPWSSKFLGVKNKIVSKYTLMADKPITPITINEMNYRIKLI